MITEDYCSFEVAKLLKEKGFDESCYGRYSVRSKEFHLDTTKPCNNGGNFLYSAPTHQMAMKWLRKEHGLHCYSNYDYVLGWYCQITSLKETVSYDYEEMKYYHPDNDNGFKSSEEACESAIKYCLENLI